MANKKKRCKYCKHYFIAESMIKVPAGTFCTFEHAQEFVISEANKKKEAKKAKQFKEMKQRVDSQGIKAKAMKTAQSSFNAFIRERDKDRPCISCGNTNVKNKFRSSAWDAGHYRSRGANPELRFNEDNCFKQCVHCNRDLSGNVVNMRNGILHRIGQKRLDIIEGPHEIISFTLDDLKEIAAKYRKKTKDLKSQSES